MTDSTAPSPTRFKTPVPPAGSMGYTLLEVTAALTLIAILLGWSLPLLGRGLDRWAVMGAREALVASIGAARAAALERGGSWLVVDSQGGVVLWGEGVDSLGVAPISDEWGVQVTGGAAGSRPIRFDDLALGQMASRTIAVSRGSARGGISLSSYGRVRRW